MSEARAEKAVEKVAENVHKHRDAILMALGFVGIALLIWWLLRTYRIVHEAEKIGKE